MNQQRKHALLSAISAFWRTKHAPRVIYYHSIHPVLNHSVTPDDFRQQIEWLQANGYLLLTFADAVHQVLAGKAPDRTVSITFDDGYLDNYDIALPILVEYDTPATFFVVSGMIGQSPLGSEWGSRLNPARHMMAAKHLRELVSLGMEVGSHTRSHIHVRNELRKSRSSAWRETAGSRQELEDIVGTEVASFAYPNGQKGVFDAATRALLGQAGYKCAATTICGYLDQRSDPMEAPRVKINGEDSLSVFRSKVLGRYDYLRWIHLTRDGSKGWEASG